MVPKKKKNSEKEDWQRLGEQEFLEQYNKRDSAYDNIKLAAVKKLWSKNF